MKYAGYMDEQHKIVNANEKAYKNTSESTVEWKVGQNERRQDEGACSNITERGYRDTRNIITTP